MAKSKLTPSQREQAVQMYVDGANLYQVAKTYGIDHSSVYALMRNRGIARRSHRFPFNESYFDQIDTEEKAYFLGWLYADGYSRKDRGVIRLVLQQRDGYILERFAQALAYTGKVYLVHRKDGRVYRGIALNSKRFSHGCLMQGITPQKSFTLQFPTKEQVPFHLLNHFVRGYFDGDGWMYYRKSSAEAGFISSLPFIDIARKTLHDILETKPALKRHPSKKVISLRFQSRRGICAFMDWIYTDATICLMRKRDKYHAYKASFKYRDRQCPSICLPI